MMSFDAKRAEHTGLVLGMADRQGLDLQEMTMRAEFTEELMEQAVDRCVGCTNPESCRQVLDSQDPNLGLPTYCRNTAMFGALKSS